MENTFFDSVYRMVKKIPYGRVSSYGAIASYLGAPGAARMVGWAMNQAHKTDPSIPAHRVVNRKGMLTGKHHFGAPQIMQQLLESEGVKVINDQVQDFHNLHWDPAKDLSYNP